MTKNRKILTTLTLIGVLGCCSEDRARYSLFVEEGNQYLVDSHTGTVWALSYDTKENKYSWLNTGTPPIEATKVGTKTIGVKLD